MKQTIKNILEKVVTAFSPYKVFDIYVACLEHTSEEDSKCPASWRGSGCYDIDYYRWQYIRLKVCARSVREARDAFAAWCKDRYDSTYNIWMKKLQGRSWAESSAKEHAGEASLADSEFLGIMVSPDSRTEVDSYDPNEVDTYDSFETDWSRSDGEECSLEEALEGFGVN